MQAQQCGVSRVTLHRLLRGKSPSNESIGAILGSLDASFDSLFHVDGGPQ
ncbi:hypothetical protein Lfu02_14690 [Longispora fulva]|nr:helix-turn-helix domain-containing protein [Longispora fulva]GIG57097.1 hypothetical protein Lfu02_14690 [Longispora fulva]